MPGLYRDRLMRLRRIWVQLLAALGQNSYFPGFITGRLYTGPLKKACVPGLNCWSCPGAVGACPIGGVQGVASSGPFSLGLYPWGFLLLFGGLLGRFVCGWLCPFGLVQDLLHRLPGKKRALPKWLRFPKYLILLGFVILLPAWGIYGNGIGDPWYCKYLCPAGTLEAGIPLVLLLPPVRQAIGLLYYWRLGLLLVTLCLAVFFYRFFCHSLCPLGAFYALCNKVSLLRLSFNKEKCITCGACRRACHSGLDPTREIMSRECILCGECSRACPTGALGWKSLLGGQSMQGSKAIPPKGEKDGQA